MAQTLDSQLFDCLLSVVFAKLENTGSCLSIFYIEQLYFQQTFSLETDYSYIVYDLFLGTNVLKGNVSFLVLCITMSITSTNTTNYSKFLGLDNSLQH